MELKNKIWHLEREIEKHRGLYDGGLHRDNQYTTELIRAGNLKSQNIRMVIDALKHQIDTQKHVLKKLKKQHGTYKNHEHEIDEHLKEVFFQISTKLII